MKFLFIKKYLPVAIVALLVVAIFGLASGGVALAQVTPVTGGTSIGGSGATAPTTPANATTVTPSGFDCSIWGNGWVTCMINSVANFISQIFDSFIIFGGWLIQIGLQLNANVYNSPFIQTGFGVCLSIANLGFVLAIIVIAIATILRSDTYGYKKTLWRLVAMAILVNFGLVITAPIVNFADGMTNYFLTTISGGSADITGFVNQMAQQTNIGGANQPPPTTIAQCMANTAATSQGQLMTSADIQEACNRNANVTLTPATAVSQSMLSLIFAIIFKIIIAIAFFCIAALMFVRYIWLAILLVLLPLAWLTWIFPKFSGEFGRWWNNFIKWTFFAPAAMFFIWLSLGIQHSVANGGYFGKVAATGVQSGNGNTAAAALAASIGNSPFLNQLMNNIVIIAILLGGLIAASSLTGKAGSFVVEQAKGTSKVIQGYAGKQSKKLARVTYQKAGGKHITSALQEGRYGLKYIPLVGRGASLAGRAISNASSNEKLVDEAKKKVPKSPDEIRANLRGSMNKEDQLAHIAKLVEMGELRERYKDKDGNMKDEMVGGQTMRDFLNTNLSKDSDIAHRFGQVKMGGDADKAVGGDKAVRLAEDQLKIAKASGASEAVIATAMKKLDDAMGEFIEKMQKSDIAKINVNEIFQHDTERSRALLKQFALRAPQLVTGALPKMKAKNLATLDATYRDVIAQTFVEAHIANDAATQERLVGVSHGGTLSKPWKDSVLGRYDKSFGSNATGFSGTGGGGGGGHDGDEH